MLGAFLNSSPAYLLRKSLLLNLELSGLAAHAVYTEPGDSPVSASPVLGLYVYILCMTLLCGCWGSEVRFSCFCNKVVSLVPMTCVLFNLFYPGLCVWNFELAKSTVIMKYFLTLIYSIFRLVCYCLYSRTHCLAPADQ